MVFGRGPECDGQPIGAEYAILPPVECVPAKNYDPSTNPRLDCTLAPYCIKHSDCKAAPYGHCVGAITRLCDYGIVPEPCEQDSDCSALPSGSCSPLEHDTRCYPDGHCDVPARRCAYPPQACELDSDCNAVASGKCALLMVESQCKYDNCQTDADCDQGTASTASVCLCSVNTQTNRCVPNDCLGAEGCSPGYTCRAATDCSGDLVGMHCTTPNDTCTLSRVCPSNLCEFVTDRWQCRPEACPSNL
ncbi:MAG: hypothetical protein QM756_35515 [Polyangiaceae bacterium]